jgi:hypothetical protein
MGPSITLCNQLLFYSKLAIIITTSIIGIEEFIVMLVVIIKIHTDQIPDNVKYIDNEVGSKEDEKKASKSNLNVNDVKIDDLEKSRVSYHDMTLLDLISQGN